MKLVKKIIISGCLLSMCTLSCKKEQTKPEDEPIVQTPEDSLAVFSDIQIGNHHTATLSGFLCLRSGEVYTLNDPPKAADHQARIDLVYYYTATAPTSAYLGAPSTLGNNQAEGGLYDSVPNGVVYWATINETAIMPWESVSVGDFISITTYSELKAAWGTTGLMPHYVSNVQSGKVYRFITHNQKIGLLRIKSISGNGNVAAVMTVDIKIQK